MQVVCEQEFTAQWQENARASLVHCKKHDLKITTIYFIAALHKIALKFIVTLRKLALNYCTLLTIFEDARCMQQN